MSPKAPEWRRSKADAVLDAEVMGWDKFKIKKTKFEKWTGNTETWYKAEQTAKTKVWTHADD